MQADGYARFAFGDQFSLYLQGGSAATSGSTSRPRSRIDSVTDRLISNEHYLMWRPSATGPYLRIGKFFAPYGLRFVEHIFFVQRYTGFDIYNETYNVSGGYVADDWELHLTLFAPPPESFPNPLQSVGVRESGGAAYGEKRFKGMAALGLQTRIGVGSEMNRYEFGAVGKAWARPGEAVVPRRGELHQTGGEHRLGRAKPSSSRTWAPRSFRPAA